MDESRIGRLNERQKQCLRLYHAQLEAKEIAKKLGIPPHTVNEHLRDARRILGVGRSIHAARLLAEHERDNSLGAEPFGVDPEQQTEEKKDATLPETTATVARKSRYHLTTLQRLGLIVAIAFLAV